MPLLTLTEAKDHLRVLHIEDDYQIDVMIAAAHEHLASIGVDVEADPAPAPLKMAAQMLVEHFYTSRGLVDAEGLRLSPVFFRLIAPYREIVL